MWDYFENTYQWCNKHTSKQYVKQGHHLNKCPSPPTWQQPWMVSRGRNRPAHSACSSAVKGDMRWLGENWISTLREPPLAFRLSSPVGLIDRSWRRRRGKDSCRPIFICFTVCVFCTLGSSGAFVWSSRVKERSIELRLTRFTFFFTFCPNIRGPSFTCLCLGSSTSSYIYRMSRLNTLVHDAVKWIRSVEPVYSGLKPLKSCSLGACSCIFKHQSFNFWCIQAKWQIWHPFAAVEPWTLFQLVLQIYVVGLDSIFKHYEGDCV